MKKKLMAVLCFALILSTALINCGENTRSSSVDDGNHIPTGTIGSESENLMLEVTAREVNVDNVPTENQNAILTDFFLRLLQNNIQEGENTLISPLSLVCALGMTGNGADGETLAQMEETFGLSIEDLNQYLYVYTHGLPQGDAYKLTQANAIWFRDREDLVFQETFLQTNADWYGAGLYKAPFDDSTLEEINSWVEENTDGMIQEILDQIDDGAVMYLINALAYDAEWENIYKEYQVRDGIFTAADGTEQEAEMMHSEEHLYLEDENAVGLMKYYADRSYAFVALLPNEGISLTDYAASLDGERLNRLLNNPQGTVVYATIPKFQCEYGVEMSDILQTMGMINAFDSQLADFSRLGTSGEGNIFINRVLHKTYIAVDERGTRAGASTAVEMMEEGAPMDPKTVYLDRPFVYMLIDCEENFPVFIGTLERLNE